ncbi:hypothetical protein PG987_015704 [Apiospora arundinis]
MQFPLVSLSILASVASVAECWTPASSSGSDQAATESLAKLKGSISRQESEGAPGHPERRDVRLLQSGDRGGPQEYSTLSNEEKLDYTRATRTIHRSGSFLAWHRHYVWTFEQALRDECGYKGYLPYWSWAKSSQDPINSPYLDGSEYSQGGNGEYEPHNCTRGLASNLLCIEPGQGGGCVKTGPYAGVMANLTATVPSWPGITAKEPFSYDPRCIRHDISVPLAQKWSGDEHIVDLLLNPLYQTDIGAFQDRLQYTGNNTFGWYGLHQFGHFLTNGDPSGDFFNSPNEPLFWLHHGMVDRVWWIWQNQKPVERAFQVDGTRTMNNKPPSDNVTIEDTFDMGYNGGEVVIKDLVSTVAGPYCYIYL